MWVRQGKIRPQNGKSSPRLEVPIQLNRAHLRAPINSVAFCPLDSPYTLGLLSVGYDGRGIKPEEGELWGLSCY